AGRDPEQSARAGGLSQDMSAAPSSSDPLIAVDDLHTFYGKSHILHGVSLTIGRGEVVGLLGRNGVGKSTTLKTIMGLVYPRRGRVLLEGGPVTAKAADKLSKAGNRQLPQEQRIIGL